MLYYQVHFDKVPKPEKGFDFNQEDFELDGKSQATIEIRYFCLWSHQFSSVMVDSKFLRYTLLRQFKTLKNFFRVIELGIFSVKLCMIIIRICYALLNVEFNIYL